MRNAIRKIQISLVSSDLQKFATREEMDYRTSVLYMDSSSLANSFLDQVLTN